MMLDPRKPYILTIKDDRGITTGDGDHLPIVAIKCKVDTWDGRPGPHLYYYDIGCERGHILPGKVIKEAKKGVVFHCTSLNWVFTLTEMTYDDFNQRVRPDMSEYISRHIHDLDDVQVFYRMMVHMT